MMDGDGFEIYKSLWKNLEAALSLTKTSRTQKRAPIVGDDSVLESDISNWRNKLQSILTQYKPTLSTPLKALPRSEESKKEVSSGQVTINGRGYRISPEFAKQAIQLSESLNVNEIVCVDLLRYATLQRSRYAEMEAPEIGQIIFYSERKYLLHSILTLLKSRNDISIDDSIQSLITKFTNELIVDGLPNNLTSLLLNLSREIRDVKIPEIVIYKNEERKLLAECLFYIYYQTTALSSDEVLKVLDVLLECSKEKKRDSTEIDSISFQVAYTVILTLVCLLDGEHELINPRTEDAVRNLLIGNEDFIRKFQYEVEKVWEDATFHRVVSLLWALFLNQSQLQLEKAESLLNKSMGEGSLKTLSSIVRSRTFKQDVENSDIFSGVFQDIIVALLRNSPYWMTNGTEQTYENMMELISAVHKDQAALATKLWMSAEDSRLSHFMRIVGDHLSQKLFLGYLRMLASLSSGTECADYVYRLLKNPWNKYINWDHFFNAFEQYAIDLQENPQPDQQGSAYYQHAVPVRRRMLQKEDGDIIQASLELITEVVKGSPAVRQMMEENNQWHPLDSLFTLLRCPIDPPIKSSIVLTISAFARSPELTQKIWTMLEQAQVVQTVIPTAMGPKPPEGGIKFELEEVESRLAEYPYTISFMQLIDQLITFGVPSNLGFPHRVPGFLPYLVFIRDHVFMKFDSRTYQTTSQMWQVSCYALRIFSKILQQYDMPNSDFTDTHVDVQGKDVVALKSPGYELMRGFLVGVHSSMLDKILHKIIEPGIKNLEADKFNLNGDFFEESVLLSLKIIETIQTKEPAFSERIRTSNPPVTSINHFLLRERNQIVNIAKFVGYPHNNILSLYAVRILYHLSQFTDKLVHVILESQEDLAVLTGFVEKLEADELDFSDVSGDMGAEPSSAANSIRIAILQLLQANLKSPAPNISHLLLGFSVHGRPMDTDLESSSVVNCLHVILSLLDNDMFPQQYPILAEACYELIYDLCADPNTGIPTMRLLRSRSQGILIKFIEISDFYSRQLQLLPPRLYPDHAAQQLTQRGWLMKTVALELHSEMSTLEHKQQLLSLLFDEEQIPSDEQSMDENERREQPRMKLLEFLESITFPLEEPPVIKRTIFTNVNVEECKYRGSRGAPLYDIKALHKLLREEQARIEYGISVSQQASVTDEIRSILSAAIQNNNFNELFVSQCFAFECWRQIVEITLLDNYEFLRSTVKEALLYELLEILLQRQNAEDSRIALATLISGAILTLITKLRVQKLFIGNTFDASVFTRDLPIDTLHSIAGGIVTGILRNGNTHLMRGNLYSSLLNYLQFIRKPTLFVNPQQDDYSQIRHLEEFEAQQKLLEDGTFSILDAVGEKLVKALCEDASDAPDICKSIAFSTLDVLLSYDRKHLWLEFLNQRGFLNHFVSTIKSKEEDLFSLLRPNPENLRSLYVYESKLSLLIKISQSTPGTLILLGGHVLKILTSCTFMDTRPEEIVEQNEHLPSISQRYEQLVIPIFRLLNSMITSHPKNEDIASKILEFVDAHSDLFITIIKDRGAVTQSSVDILFLVTELFYHLAFHSSLFQHKLLSKAGKFEALMINLLTKYCVRERWEPLVKTDDTGFLALPYITTDSPSDIARTLEPKILNITRNVIAFCRISMEKDSKRSDSENRSSCRVLFTPSVKEYEALARAPLTVGSTGRPPSLAIVVHYLKYCIDLYLYTAKLHEMTANKLRNINEIPREDVQELASQVKGLPRADSISPQQRQFFAQRKLAEILAERSKTVNTLVFIIENLLWILWRHLDFYFNQYLYSQNREFAGDAQFFIISTNELENLRRDIGSALNQIQSGQTESTLGLLTKLDKVRYPNQTNSIIYFVVRQLKELQRRI